MVYDRHYFDGAWQRATSQETIDVFDSISEGVMATVPAGTPEEVDAAVAAANRAFPSWSATGIDERADLLVEISDGLAARAAELAEVITRETGMAQRLSRPIQVGMPVKSFRIAADALRAHRFEGTVGNSLVVHEPIGVVGCITPWNYPLHQIASKVAYALAAGCVVVVKPSEVAPVDAQILAEVIDAAGLPPGVFNLVFGTGPVVGEALAAHPSIDMISFTGSTAAGRRVAQLAAQTIKKVALELGGKSANVLLDDLDDVAFAAAVRSGVGAAFLNSGQTCTALTRLLVPEHRIEMAEAIAAEAAAALRVGDPFDDATHLGPLASAAQRDRVQGYIRAGIDGDAELIVGGPGVPDGVSTGYFVRPTVFSRVDPSSPIAREEIFGPVLAIIGYGDEDDAVRIANDSVYGLAGGVVAADPDRALRVARRLRAGQVSVNNGAFNLAAPFGGYKQSGLGREHGRHGLEEFMETKAIQQ